MDFEHTVMSVISLALFTFIIPGTIYMMVTF